MQSVKHFMIYSNGGGGGGNGGVVEAVAAAHWARVQKNRLIR